MNPAPGLICPTGFSTGFSLRWPGTRDGTRVCGWSAPCAVEGRNFHGPQRDTAWLFLIGVYSAHRVYLTEFSSLRPNGRDFPAGWSRPHSPSQSLPGLPLPHRFMVSVTRFPTVWGRISDFVELCNIFVYCRASYFRIHPLTSCRWFPHTSGLPLVSCLDSVRFTQGGARKKYFLHFIELWNDFFHNRANYFHPGANAVVSHGSRDS